MSIRTGMPPGATLLVVDDEAVIRVAVARTLETLGCQVLQADTYGDAMALFGLHRRLIQMVIADLALPDGNGCALAIALRKQRPDLQVLFVSGHAGAETCKYYGLGLSDPHFLAKPFTQKRLVRRVRALWTFAHPFPVLTAPRALASY